MYGLFNLKRDLTHPIIFMYGIYVLVVLKNNATISERRMQTEICSSCNLHPWKTASVSAEAPAELWLICVRAGVAFGVILRIAVDVATAIVLKFVVDAAYTVEMLTVVWAGAIIGVNAASEFPL